MRVERRGLGEVLVDYHSAWREQRELHAAVVAGRQDSTVLLVEHASVYTAGRRTSKAERPTDGTPVVDVDRGGRITWHGPGQLVAYPIVALREPVDVVGYVRQLEQAVIAVAAAHGVVGERVAGRSGVWVRDAAGGADRKLAAVGVRVAKGVTMHGLALNACPDLTHFARITPCGIEGAATTSLSIETGQHITPLAVADRLEHHLRRCLDAHLAATDAPVTAGARTVPATAVPLSPTPMEHQP